MANRWVEFVRKWASENNMNYMCAMTNEKCKADYKKAYPDVKKSNKDVKSTPKYLDKIREEVSFMTPVSTEKQQRMKQFTEMMSKPDGLSKLKQAFAEKYGKNEKDTLDDLHKKYLSLHREKFTNKVRKELEKVTEKINILVRPILKKELNDGYFSDEKGGEILFGLDNRNKMVFTNTDNTVIDKLTDYGRDSSATPVKQLLNAIMSSYKYRLFSGTAGLRNVEDLQQLMTM